MEKIKLNKSRKIDLSKNELTLGAPLRAQRRFRYLNDLSVRPIWVSEDSLKPNGQMRHVTFDLRKEHSFDESPNPQYIQIHPKSA